MPRGELIPCLATIMAVTLACTVTILMLLVILRYDPTCPRARRRLRWRAFYEDGYWASRLAEQPDTPFQVVGGAVSPSSSVVSFSLYGTNPKYYRYMPGNLDTIRTLLPGWRARVYAHEGAPWISQLRARADVDVLVVRDAHAAPGNSGGAFWRFLPLCEDVDCVILDSDDAITGARIREIREFFDPRNSSLLRGHDAAPWPLEHLAAGELFKKRALTLPYTVDDLRAYPRRSEFGSDEVFLATEVAVHVDRLEKPWRLHHVFVKEMVVSEPWLGRLGQTSASDTRSRTAQRNLQI